MRAAPALLLALLAACSSSPQDEPPVVIIIDEPDQASAPGDMTSAPDLPAPPADMPQPADMGEDQAPDMIEQEGLPGGPMPVLPTCAERGLPARAFDASATGAALDALAADLTVQTSRGAWTLSEQWTGCDSYVFLTHYSGAAGDALWATLDERLFKNSAPNTVYLIATTLTSTLAAQAKLIELSQRVDAALSRLPAAEQARWRSRVHYITTPPQQAAGSLPALLSSSRLAQPAVAVDQRQRWDLAGSLTNINASGFIPDLNIAAYMSRYHSFRDAQERRLSDERGVTVVPLMSAQRVSENNQLYGATFPDAATMASFDTLEIDIQAACGPAPTDCGEWDYEAFLERCRDEACAQADTIALWITQYSRPGTSRWVVDATPLLPLFKQGGAQQVRFGMLWNMNPNVMDVSFRLSKRGAGAPLAAIPLFEGGDFNASYNEREPITFEPPAGATRAELVTLLTGHGQEAANSCAEWCDHVHTFTVNGARRFIRSFPGEAGVTMGCAEQVDQGVVPGQYGNWTPQRAAWCPGLAVQPVRQDITAAITPGQPNTIAYQGSYRGGAPAGGRIRLSSYLVFY